MEKFLVKIPCKSYVKRFMEINYGSPADLSKDKGLYLLFRSKLEKKSFRHEQIYNTLTFSKYSDEIDIKISRDDFYRHGWELSKTDIVNLNQILEGRTKMLMYTVVGSLIAMGIPRIQSIDYFQEKYMFPEDIWPRDSIERDCKRNLEISKNVLASNLTEFIDKICLAKLSENRTILRKAKQEYENNKI